MLKKILLTITMIATCTLSPIAPVDAGGAATDRSMKYNFFTGNSQTIDDDGSEFMRLIKYVAIIQKHKEEALAGISEGDLNECLNNLKNPVCETVWEQIITNLTRIISVSYKPTNSMSLFDPVKVQFSATNTQLLILAAQ